jgi:phosphatidylglycerophosphate synthase
MKSSLCFLIVVAGLILLLSKFYIVSILLIVTSFSLFIAQNKATWENLSYYGIANLITTSRLLLVLLLVFFSGKLNFTDYYLLRIVLIIPVLDIVDGFIARFRNEQSKFGMYYDMEVDALFVMVASILVFLNYPSMWIVLIPAFLRYFYKFTLAIMDSAQKFVEAKEKYASIIAGNYFIALIIFYFIQNEWASVFLVVSSILIVLSFAKSYYRFYKWSNELI